jgi:hypothetical protein
LALLTGKERKPLRAACRAGRDAVDAGITWLKAEDGGGGGWFPPQPSGWQDPRTQRRRLPSLRHLSIGAPHPAWREGDDAVAWCGAASALAAHLPALRSLHLTESRGFHRLKGSGAAKLAGMEALLATPMPALERLEIFVDPMISRYNEEQEREILELLRPLSRLSAPRLARLKLHTQGFCDGRGLAQMVRWVAGARLPALRRLALSCTDTGDMGASLSALTARRWAALESLQLWGRLHPGSVAPAVSAALAPTLRSFTGLDWPFGGPRHAAEWPQLRSLSLEHGDPLAEQLGGVRLPRLEVASCGGAAGLRGLGARRAALPALRAVEIQWGGCMCDDYYRCRIDDCAHPDSVALREELRRAWPALEVRAWRGEPDPLCRPGDPDELFYDNGEE